MGYAVPAAMGAALGAPERETWAIVGDGGFQMTMQELATLVQDQIPVRIAVLNNHRLGMIRQWQEIIYDENYHSAELLGPDLVRLCEAYGIPAWRATRPDEVDAVIAEARKAPGPALIDFHLDEAQNVYPDDAARQGPLRHGRRGAPNEATARPPRQTLPAGEPDAEHRRHVVSALVVDRPGTLNRVSGLLRARSFNIESLTVGTTHEPGKSRMTIAIRGDDGHLRQVLAQLERIIEVLEVTDLTSAPHVELELALVELDPPADPGSGARPARASLAVRRRRDALNRPDGTWRARLTATARRRSIAPSTALRGHGLRRLVRAGAVAMATSTADLEQPTAPRERSDPVMTKLIYDADIDASALDGQTVAVIGYGSQGEAHARNLSESGVDVVVGLRPDSTSADRAREAGLRVTDAGTRHRRGERGDGARARHRGAGGLPRRGPAEPP